MPSRSESRYLTKPINRWPAMGSVQVSWWDTHTYVAPVLARVGSWPAIGTPQWCALPDDHPAKIAAVFDAAQHHALRIELAQEACAQASRDVSQAADWPAVATQVHRRAQWHADRPWLKRVAS